MQWPFIGRADELSRLRQAVSDPRCHGVVIAGAAGTGKTRLASECLDFARELDLRVTRVVASRAVRDVPFGALAQLMPEQGPAAGSEVDDRASRLRIAAQALADPAAGDRLLLMVDDAHLLDDLSAVVVYQLTTSTPAFILATVRVGEPAPDPVHSLWKDGLVERLELGSLTAAEVEHLLARVLDGTVDPGASSVLAQRCRGNALYLRELVEGAIRDGTLRSDGGLWRLVGPLAPSDRLAELVETRLAGLEPAEESLLELVSFGEPLGAAELGALSDPLIAESLEHKGLLTSSVDGRRLQLRLAHPLYGDVLRARIPATRARTIARALAETVEATGARRRGDTLRIASWRLTGGGGSAELMHEAASIARWHYDWDLAERLGRAGLQAGAGLETRLLMAQLSSLQGRTAEAESILSELADQAMNDDQRVRVAISRLDNLLYSVRAEHGLRVAERAEATVTDGARRDEIAARRAWILAAADGPRAAIELAETIVGRSSGRAMTWACLVAGYCLTRLGRLDDALAVSARGYDTHCRLDSPLEWYPWWHLFVRCESLTYAGRLEEAGDLAAGQHQRALADRSPEAQAYFACQLARVMRERGRVRTSAGHAREAVALFRQLDRPMFVRDGLQDLALAAALSGAEGEARSAIEALTVLKLSPYMHTGVELVQAQAWTSVAGGNLARARELFESAASLGERIGDLVNAAEALHALARIGRAKDVAGRIADVCRYVDGPLAAARATHVAGLAAGDPEALESVSTVFEGLGTDLLAAEGWADAAVVWRRRGDRRRAAAAQRRAIAAAAVCEGASTPSLHSVVARAVLAPAEREAAVLAAAGASNKEIAGQLGVAVRSVENRLQHVYSKLGISGRGELAAALGQVGVTPERR
jgi:DNA-binding CsgD family transcriptional regulator